MSRQGFHADILRDLSRRFSRRALAIAALLFLLAGGAWGANRAFTWTGAIDSSWSTPGNWTSSGGTVSTYPDSDGSGTDTADFSPAGATTSSPQAGCSLASLNVGANGTVAIGADTLTVGGYSGGGEIAASGGTLVSTAGAGITLATLTVGAGGVSLTGGNGIAVIAAVTNAITLNSGSATLNGTTITSLTVTAGTLNLNGPIQTTADVVLSTLVGGTNSLIVGGNATFNGAVSGLTTLRVTGTSAINTTAVTTSGTQTYDSTVTLGANVVLTASDVNSDLAVVGGGNDLTLACSSPISLALGSLSGIRNFTTNGGSTTTVSGTLTTTGTQTWTDATILSADTGLAGTTITMSSTVGGGTTSGLLVTGNGAFWNTVTGLTTLRVTGTSAINTTTVTSSGTQTYDGQVTLGANANLTGSTVTFNDPIVGGAHSLTVTGIGVFGNAVGDTVSGLTTLRVTGTSAINTTAVTSSGTQTYDGQVTLGANANLTGSTVTFNDPIVGVAHSLTVTGIAAFGNAVGDTVSGLTTLRVTGTSAINTTTVTSSGTQTYDGQVTLGANANLTGSTVTFNDPIVGVAHSLTVTGIAAFGNAVGDTVSGLTTLRVTGTSAINTTTVTTSGTQTYDSTVTLGANVVLTASDVNSDLAVVGGGNDLTLACSSPISLALGSLSGIRNFTTNGGSTTTVSGTLTTTGTQTWTDATILSADTGLAGTTITMSSTVGGGTTSGLLVTGNGAFWNTVTGLTTLRVTGTSSINTTTVTSSGTQTYDGQVTLGANANLTGSTVTFNDPIVGVAHSLTVTGIGVFGNAAGDTVSGLTTLRVTGTSAINTTAVTTSGTQTYDGQVTLGANANLTGSTVTFNDPIVGVAHSLTVTGIAAFGNAVGDTVSGLTTLRVTGTSAINTMTVTSSGTQTYDGQVTLGANANLTGSTVTFGSTVVGGTNSLAITGNAIFGNAVSGLSTLSVSGTSAINTTTVTSSGTQTYDGQVTLGANANLTGSTVTFNDPIVGVAHSLTVTGIAAFGNAVGDTVSGLTTLRVTGTSAINTTTVTSSGTQTYDGQVTLGANANLTGSTVTFNDPIVGVAHSLTVTGIAAFGNAVGDTVSGLTTLRVTSTSAINTTAVTTSGTQTYDSTVTLGANVVLTASDVNSDLAVVGGGNDLTLACSSPISLALGSLSGIRNFTTNGGSTTTVSGTLTTTGTQTWTDATILSADTGLAGTTITMSSTVGGGTTSGLLVTGNGAFWNTVTGLTTLRVTGTSSINTTTVTSSGTQNYDGPVTLGANATLSGAAITIASTVDADLAASNRTLTVNGSGATTFGGAVGTTQSLSSVSVVSAAAIISAGITTSGIQSISATSIQTNGLFHTTDSTISFSGDLALTGSTTIRSGTALSSFSADVTVGAFTLDFEDSPFAITGTLSNNGTVRLQGSATQVVGGHSIGTTDVDSGVFEYYGAGGTVFGTGLLSGGFNYYDLRINGTGTFNQEQDIVLARDLTIDGGALSIAGTIDTTLGDDTVLTIGRDWTNNVGAAGFNAGASATIGVRFAHPTNTTFRVRGYNVWYIFICQQPGATILFENDSALAGIQITQRIATGGIFRIRGLAGSRITLDRITDTGTQPGIPPADPGDDDEFWFFDVQPGAKLEMQFANVYHSNARADPISVPDDVSATPYATYRCFKWLDFLYAVFSYTEDTDFDGKIDRIRVTCEQNIGNDFSGFLAAVDGYDIDIAKGTNGYERPAIGTAFYIYLKEKPYLDTGVTPAWRIVANTTLYDEATLTKRVGTLSRAGGEERMIPGDTAWPVIGYALTIPLNDGTFVHFSEPVVQTFGGSLAAGDFGATSFARVSGTIPATREALVGLGALGTASLAAGLTGFTVTASSRDLGSPPYWEAAYNGQVILAPVPTYPDPATGYLANPNTYGSFGSPSPNPGPMTRPAFRLGRGGKNVHRVSDLLISVPPSTSVGSWSQANADSWFAWPLWARDGISLSLSDTEIEALTPAQTAAQGIGLIRGFDGTQWLRDMDWTMQTRLAPVMFGLGRTPSVVYDSNVSSTLISPTPGIWLPPYDESTEFSGLAACPNGGTSIKGPSVAPPVPPLYEYDFSASDPKVFSVAHFDFYYHLLGAPANLYAGRLADTVGATTIPVNWYRLVRPFSLDIHDAFLQKGGATILNNVIDPTKGETVRLSYQLAKSGAVTVTVFTLDGDVVARLENNSSVAAGDHAAYWNGRNLAGSPVARGLYFIRIVAPGMDEIRKVLVVRK